MLFRKGILIGVALLSMAFLGGCALSPQQLNPNPIVSANLPVLGHGQAINVKVVDGRASNVLGTRGGLYSSTSNITVESSAIIAKLQTQAEEALSKMGYKPQSSGANATLTITVSELAYKATAGYFIRSADVTAVLRSQLQTTSKTYNGRYSASVHEEFSSAPDIEANTKLVSEVLGNALTRLLKDTELTGSM